MTIRIRNVRTPSGTAGYFMRWIPWLWREVLLIGRWTEVANNGDAAWASNILNTYSDLSVTPSEPYVVRSVAGSFDSSQVGKLLSLFDPTNDANCILARIAAVLSATAVRLDGICFAKPWVAASGLTGRVHSAGQTSYLAAGAWTVLQSPGANPYQVRFSISSGTVCAIQAYPKCDYATTGYLTAAINFTTASNEWTVRMNADIEENNFNQYFFSDRSSPWVRYCVSGGSLTDVAVGDTWANFVTASGLVQSQDWLFHPWSSAAWCGPMKMIGYSDEQIDAYAEAPKRFSNDSVNTYGLWSGNFDVFRKWCNGKIVIGYPRIITADVATGGYVRGKLPWPVVNYLDWKSFATMDAAATWRKGEGCLLMPHGGLAGCDRFPALWEF